MTESYEVLVVYFETNSSNSDIVTNGLVQQLESY